ncbi:MAG: C2H2-type zinc finger protein [Bryobacteraceae bacterium]
MQEQQSKGQQPQSQNFRCKECGKTLNSAEQLREHEKTHQGHGQGQQGQGQQGQGQQGQGQQGQGQQKHGQQTHGQEQGGTTHKAGGGGGA